MTFETSTTTLKSNNSCESYLGRHVLVEFFDCNNKILNDIESIEKFMVKAALECGATVVEKCFHSFNPCGISGVVIISESHLAIHTWPEKNYAAVDLFTCGTKCDPKISYEYLKQAFEAKESFYSELERGILDPQTSHVKNLPFKVVSQS